MRLYALRGANSVTVDQRQPILDATRELMEAVIERNQLQTENLVSCLFTATPDLTAEFPALAAREMGLSGVPLMCAQEIGVEKALPRIIRVMVHCYLADGLEPQHVYLGEARALRVDLQGAQ